MAFVYVEFKSTSLGRFFILWKRPFCVNSVRFSIFIMHFSIPARVVVAAAVLFPGVISTAATDEYRDADQLQSGYLPNHNMDPAIVNSAGFGQLWRVSTGGADTTAGEGGGDEG